LSPIPRKLAKKNQVIICGLQLEADKKDGVDDGVKMAEPRRMGAKDSTVRWSIVLLAEDGARYGAKKDRRRMR